MGGRDSPGVHPVVGNGAAKECARQGSELHTEHVAETPALFRLCGSGVVKQPGGKLHAAGGTGKKELAARWQRQGGTESSSDLVHRGILPPARTAFEGISAGRFAGARQSQALRHRFTYSQSLDSRPQLTSTGTATTCRPVS